jgi:phosphatidylglycerophosphate synthase
VEATSTRQLVANGFSALGAALCAAAGMALATGLPLPAAAALFGLGAACDLVDGPIARGGKSKEKSRLGGFIDSFSDKVGEVGLFAGLLVFLQDQPGAQLLAALAFGAAWLTSWAKAFAEAERLAVDWWDARILGRATRAVLLTLTLLLASLSSSDFHAIWTTGLTVLLVFNCTTLMSRLTRVISSSSQLNGGE